MDFFITPAWAQVAGSTAGTLGTILPLVLIFVVFYFLLIRPQTKRAKEHREMVGKLAAGDEVVTTGGILGRISEVGEHFIALTAIAAAGEAADGTPLRRIQGVGDLRAGPGAWRGISGRRPVRRGLCAAAPAGGDRGGQVR